KTGCRDREYAAILQPFVVVYRPVEVRAGKIARRPSGAGLQEQVMRLGTVFPAPDVAECFTVQRSLDSAERAARGGNLCGCAVRNPNSKNAICKLVGSRSIRRYHKDTGAPLCPAEFVDAPVRRGERARF